MLILLRTQVERTAKAPIPACHARVGGLCGFRDTVERPRRKPENRTLRRRAGALAKNARIGKNGSGKSRLRQMQENAENGQNRGILGAAARKRRESGEKAGQSRGVVRAPRRSHLPAVRAVSGIYEGVPNTAKNGRRALRNEKSPPFQGKQRGSNEIYEVNTEKW